MQLHAATELDELWKTVLPLLASAFDPCVRVTLFLGHFGMRAARLVFTDPPIPNPSEWYQERSRNNPFTAYIDEHRRITHYRFSDVLGTPRQFAKTTFHQDFAIAEGWDLGLSGLLWSGDEVKAMFSIYRKSPQTDFRDDEVARLLELRPHIETAIHRVEKLHAERLHRKALEEFNRFVPIGLMLLDWDLSPVFANNEAYKECAVWNFGIEESRTYNTREVFALPTGIQAKCESIRADILRTNPKDKLEVAPELNRLTHPKLTTHRASITALNASPGLLAKPGFLVVLEDRSSEVESPGKPAPRKQKLLWMLSPSEREIALLICEGQSNAAIAKQLKKSILTIKKQITSIFKKTEVTSRAQFMALLR
jgi:DNA-binding CsgD family transcriptional regulator